jgi:DNA-binding NtrC family response regulator
LRSLSDAAPPICSPGVFVAVGTVLVIEDQFLESYELECALKERGYEFHHAGTQAGAMRAIRKLIAQNDVDAIICDNRLLGDQPAAAFLYRQVRAMDAKTPFVVYSGYPPQDLPKDDPRLKVVRKPFIDQVLSFIETITPPGGRGSAFRSLQRRREAA